MSNFGELVKRLRKDRRLTLDQVARRIGSHKGYVSGIENGKVNPPSVKFIRKFARLFSHDEKEMVRIAFVDKAPRVIRDEVRQALGDGAAAPAAPRGGSAVLLLNTIATGYPTDLDGARVPKALTADALTLPSLPVKPEYALTVCDNSMEAPEGYSLSKGDLVLLAPEPKIRHGAVVFVIFNARERRQAVVRQVMLEQNEHVVLQPLNKDYPLEFLTHDDIDAIFRVVGHLQTYDVAVPEPRKV